MSFVPILDRPEERSQSIPDGSQLQRGLSFQSSIAPKNDRNHLLGPTDYLLKVPILDRPEERSQYHVASSGADGVSVPILDRPEERSQSGHSEGPQPTEGSNPRSPRRTIAITVEQTRLAASLGSNPRSPRRTIAIATPPPSDPENEFQSSIAPKNDRNVASMVMKMAALKVPILDRPEERSQYKRILPDPKSSFSSNPRSPRRTIAI